MRDRAPGCENLMYRSHSYSRCIMRTQLLIAVAFLCGAAAAQGQYWPANQGMPGPYAGGYPQAGPVYPAMPSARPNYLPPGPSVPMAEMPPPDPKTKPDWAGCPPTK